MNAFLARLAAGPPILADGGTGTERTRLGTDAAAVHRAFVDAGAELVVADSVALATAALDARAAADGTARAAGAMTAAVRAARESGAPLVAASLGPTALSPDDTRRDAVYTALAAAAAAAGADVAFAETLLTLEDAASALAAARRASLPVCVTFAVDGDGRGFAGLDVEAMARWAVAVRPDAAGFNCGVGPDPVLEAGARFAAAAPGIPLVLRPAASAPGAAAAPPEAFAAFGRAAIAAGARIVGGCCGATSLHVSALRQAMVSAP